MRTITVYALAIGVFAGAMTLGPAADLGTATVSAQAAPQAAGRGRGASRLRVLGPAPTDRAVPFSLETLKKHLAMMDAEKLETLRMLEGGRYNVNIRRIRNAETGLVHPVTVDLWVVLEGSGTLTTGGKLENGKIVGGESHPIKAGDVEFIPAGVPHGVSGVNGNITWLNVRWDSNYPPS